MNQEHGQSLQSKIPVQDVPRLLNSMVEDATPATNWSSGRKISEEPAHVAPSDPSRSSKRIVVMPCVSCFNTEATWEGEMSIRRSLATRIEI